MRSKQGTSEHPSEAGSGSGLRLDRRSFLILGGTAAGAASIAAVPGAPRAVDWLAEQEVHRDLPESFIESVCGDCPAGCPVLLRKVGERIVGVRPRAPKPCLRAYTIPQQIVHPDRIRGPRARDGARGQNRWQDLAPEEALNRLAGLLQAYRGRTAFLLADDGELASLGLGVFGGSLGAPLVGRAGWPFADGPLDALREATGWDRWEPDLAGASGVMTFGHDFLQRTVPPIRMQEAYRHLRAPDHRRPVVSVGPRLDLTASKADEWLACRVGTEPLVALALAAVIVREGWQDPAAAALPGFDSLAKAVRTFDMEGACSRSAVKASDIDRMARYLGRRRWICLGPRRRRVDQRPVVLLNALLGNVHRKGGWVAVPRLRLASQRAPFGNGEEIPHAVDSGRIDLVVIYGQNPAYAAAEPARWRAALAKAKQVVVFSDVESETVRLADLVIPLPHPAERTMRLVGLEDGKAGVRTVAPALPGPPAVPDPMELVFALARRFKGVPFPRTVEALQGAVTAVAPTVKPCHLPAPAWTAPAYSTGLFHLLLETPMALLRMTGGHLPYLITSAGPHLRRWWETTVEINPETARTLGIAEQDRVRISSEVATLQARAKLYPGVPPDAVCLPLGLGRSVGAFAGTVGGNPAELVKFRQEGGLPLWDQTKVNVERI